MNPAAFTQTREVCLKKDWSFCRWLFLPIGR